MEQQPFTPEGLGTCLGTVLKLLPITYVNQLAEGSAKVSECARFAYAEKGERLGTLQPHATDFDVSIFLFGKRNFLPGLRWKSSRQQLSWACTPWLAPLRRALCLWQNGKYVENELAFSFSNHHFLTSFTSWAQQCHGTPGLFWCRIKSMYALVLAYLLLWLHCLLNIMMALGVTHSWLSWLRQRYSSGGVYLKLDHVASEAGNHILLWG